MNENYEHDLATIRAPRRVGRRLPATAMSFVLAGAIATPARTAEWSINEIHFQLGQLEAPSFAGGHHASTTVLTFQHASGWRYGDNFLFVDASDDSRVDGYNDGDFYGEWYSNLSLSKISGRAVGAGPIGDVGILLGINAGADANVRKYLPGVRISWDLPVAGVLHTDVTAYIDDSGGVESGGAPAESDTFMVDCNGAIPFQVGRQRFSVEGHIEYIGERQNEFGEPVSWWLLAQPQIRYDLGQALWNHADQLFVGVEVQLWLNKLGDPDTDEQAVQALVVWRF